MFHAFGSRAAVGVIAAGLTALTTASTFATPISVSLSGNTEYNGWGNFTSSAFPGYGTFPGAAPWPGAITANLTGSGDAGLNKTANGGDGGGYYVGSASIYAGSFLTIPNTSGGTLEVTDATPIAGIENVVFQVEIGEGTGTDLLNDQLPTLTYTVGGSPTTLDSSGAATSGLVDFEDAGTFTPPGEDPTQLFINTYLIQWDLSGVSGTVTDIALSFTGTTHSQVYALQLDTSDSYQLLDVQYVTVPEPASMALLGAGALLIASRRRK